MPRETHTIRYTVTSLHPNTGGCTGGYVLLSKRVSTRQELLVGARRTTKKTSRLRSDHSLLGLWRHGPPRGRTPRPRRSTQSKRNRQPRKRKRRQTNSLTRRSETRPLSVRGAPLRGGGARTPGLPQPSSPAPAVDCPPGKASAARTWHRRPTRRGLRLGTRRTQGPEGRAVPAPRPVSRHSRLWA